MPKAKDLVGPDVNPALSDSKDWFIPLSPTRNVEEPTHPGDKAVEPGEKPSRMCPQDGDGRLLHGAAVKAKEKAGEQNLFPLTASRAPGQEPNLMLLRSPL